MSDSAEELAERLRSTARNAAIAALREGLEEIELRHGQHTADEVAGLIDVSEVLLGLTETANPNRPDDGLYTGRSAKKW